MNRFESSLEHLRAELERMDIRLRLEIMRLRQYAVQPAEDDFRGLYISEDDIDAFLNTSSSNTPEAEKHDLINTPEALKLRELESEIAEKKAASLKSGIQLRLHYLMEAFGLNDFEKDALLICLLPEVNTQYERLFAYIHDDVTRKKPSVNLVLKCLLDGIDTRLSNREAFLPQAPLISQRILRLETESNSKSPSLLMRDLRIDSRIANYLLGSDDLDSRLANHIHVTVPTIDLNSIVLPPQVRQEIEQVTQNMALNGPGVLYLQGSHGVGRKTLAEAVCKLWNLPMLQVNVADLLASNTAPETLVTLAFREAVLQGTTICWVDFDTLISEDRTLRTILETVVAGMAHFPGPVLATGKADWQPGSAFSGKPFLKFEIEAPEYPERRRLWETYLNGGGPGASTFDVESVADKFRFNPDQIRDAAATARNLAGAKGDTEISTGDLYAACRAMSNQRLMLFARKIQPKYSWGDIILPSDQMGQLREITNYVRYRHIVYSDWNFERRISLGKGLNALFAGPSGTGKTMAAEILANELGLDLYKIDLSTVVSKYIGETEKNLDKIFNEARDSNSILFFDEADAVFGKRSEVRDSHDRYANIEVAYLLQKMEEYDGIVILATNLKKNLDDAFARRMHFSLEFPQPEEPDRALIWKGVFPEEAPVGEDIDMNFMARQFKITGGNIKNIAVGAAFLAASGDQTIRMEHLIRATKREFQKIGRLCNENDFAEYFELVKG